MKSVFTACASITIFFCASGCVFAAPEPGTEEWTFEMSKVIAVELAQTPAWSLAAPYLVRLSPKTQDWNVLLLQAKVELQKGNIAGAESAIQRALVSNPDNPRILTMAGNIASDAGKPDEALVYLDKVLAKQPQNAQVLLAIARIRFGRQEWREVIDIYERALKLVMPTSEILVRLSAAYENTGDIAQAESCLVKNLEIHPNRILALMPLERFYQRNQMEKKAAETAKERELIQKKAGDQRNLRSLQKSSR